MAGWLANIGTKIGQWCFGGMIGYEIGKSVLEKKEEKIVVTVEKSAVKEQSSDTQYFGVIILVLIVFILTILLVVFAIIACMRTQRKNRRNGDRDGELRV